MPKARVFLDSSVIITALLSFQGGSFYILNELRESFIFQTNEYALEEIQEILKSKFAKKPEMQNQLFLLLGISKVMVLQNPAKHQVLTLKKVISLNDTPILASAVKHSDYLLTLDNEFFKSSVLELAKKKPLTILKPKDFIEKHRTAKL